MKCRRGWDTLAKTSSVTARMVSVSTLSVLALISYQPSKLPAQRLTKSEMTANVQKTNQNTQEISYILISSQMITLFWLYIYITVCPFVILSKAYMSKISTQFWSCSNKIRSCFLTISVLHHRAEPVHKFTNK